MLSISTIYSSESLPHTVTAQLKVNDVADTDIDNAQKALIAFLKFALVKDLNCDHRRIFDGAAQQLMSNS